MPSSHRMIRMTAMVSSIVACLLRRDPVSNACATSPSAAAKRGFAIAAQVIGAILLTVELTAAQEPRLVVPTDDAQSVHPATSPSAVVEVLAGGAIALGAHES